MPDWTQIMFRSLGALVMLFAITRVLGKKQISQLSFFEYVLGITLGELVGFISTDVEANYMHGVVALAVWFLVPFGIEMLTLKSKVLRDWFDGKGRVLIKEGKILEDNVKKERLTADELLEQLRTKSVFNVADVEFAVLESSGDLNILLKKEKQPLTPSSLGITTIPEMETQTVIMDGKVLDEPIATLGLSRDWLNTELEKIGVMQENVFIGQVDAYQQLYVDLFDDQIKVPAPQAKALLLSTLKKLQADLELFASSTSDEEAKSMYEECSIRMQRAVDDLIPVLQR